MDNRLVLQRAGAADVDEIIRVQNAAFYDDYVRYGFCPGYNPDRQGVLARIDDDFMYLIRLAGETIGNISVRRQGEGDYFLGCLTIVPQYQNKGLGGQALTLLWKQFPDARRWTLETPADKTGNLHFYGKHGFVVTDQYADGGVQVVLLERTV